MRIAALTATSTGARSHRSNLSDRLGDAYASLASDGGFTCDRLGRAYRPSSGYAVSLAGLESRVPLALLTPTLFDGLGRVYLHWTRKLYAATRFDVYFGGWVDGSIVVLDLSETYVHLEVAMRVGQERGQTAIYEFNGRDGREIRL